MNPNQPQTPNDRRSFTQKLHDNRKMVLLGIVLVAALIAVVVIWARTADDDRSEFAAKLGTRRQLARTGIYQSPDFTRCANAVRALEVDLADAPDDQTQTRALQDIALWSFRAAVEAESDEDAATYLDKAEAAAKRIEEEFPTSVPATRMLPLTGSSTTFTAGLLGRIAKEREYRKANAYDHPKVDPSRYALIETELGTIKFAFFPELAPKHIENFVKLAKEGFYNGLLIHRVGPEFMIQMGDPNSRDRNDFASHGNGGPGYTIAPERARFHVRHLTGVVSTAKVGGALNESGSQFFICVAPQPNLDKGYTPFGEVIEGLDAAVKISELPTMKDTEFADHPVRDVVIRSISIWKDGAIEEGHAWDTKIVNTPWSDPADEGDEGDDEGTPPDDDGGKKEEGADGAKEDDEEAGGGGD